MKSPSFRQVAPDRLEFREGGGCLSAFGLPFLLAGIFVFLMGIGIVPVTNARDVPGWAWPIICLFGVVFMAVGGGLVFGRRWSVLDKGRGRIVKRWGLLVPFGQEERDLADYDAVTIRFRAGDSDSADQYPVGLRIRSGGEDLPVQSFTAYAEAHQAGSAIARFLGYPLVDGTTAHELVVPADRAEDTLRESLRRGDLTPEDAPRPIRLRCQVQEFSDRAEIVIPAPPFNLFSLLPVVIPWGILAYLAPPFVEFFDRTRTPGFVQLAFLGFLTVVLGILPALHLISAVRRAVRGQTIVTATPEGIRIVTRSAWTSRKDRLSVADIWGVDYATAGAALESATAAATEVYAARSGRVLSVARKAPRWLAVISTLVPSKGMTIKSKAGLVTFGAGLPDEEIRYLYSILTRVLRGNAGRW